MKFLLILVLSTPVFSSVLNTKSADYNPAQFPEYMAIVALVKSLGTFPIQTPSAPTSRGAQAIEEAKARNRMILAQQKSTQVPVAADDLKAWRQQTKDLHTSWKKQILEQRQRWQKEQKAFLLGLKTYKENTFTMPVKEIVIQETPVSRDLPDAHVVNGAFGPLVKDQKGRATCSAFAGIRAMEILLAQHGQEKDLSEQYFYWASKPPCQSTPCSQKGSWITTGLEFSKSQKSNDVPTEDACAYVPTSIPQNETQLPLTESCRRGVVRVSGYKEVLTLSEALDELKKDTPVIMAAKLTENFYLNKGLVTLSDSEKVSSRDAHALGHAFLAIGFMELPQELKEKEGDLCVLVVNSWGKGWGSGGYSCLTLNWLTKYRTKAPFVALKAIEVP